MQQHLCDGSVAHEVQAYRDLEGLKSQRGALKAEAGRYLLVLGVEELDEALQEVWTLLHLTLSSFDKVLAEDRIRSVM